ncbi:MAG: deaminase [Peptococcaceae bacterium]|nr:deaminase [Peptococcaceae bacterium]
MMSVKVKVVESLDTAEPAAAVGTGAVKLAEGKETTGANETAETAEPVDPVNMQRPGWDEYFLELAAVIARRSTCLRRNYGAVIVKDNIIVSTGYNGAARGEPNCVDTGACVRRQLNVPAGERYELCVAVHAEQNAIIAGDPVKMRDATIYIAGNEADGSVAVSVPCLLCHRMIQNAMIRRVVFRDAGGVKRNVRFGLTE